MAGEEADGIEADAERAKRRQQAHRAFGAATERCFDLAPRTFGERRTGRPLLPRDEMVALVEGHPREALPPEEPGAGEGLVELVEIEPDHCERLAEAVSDRVVPAVVDDAPVETGVHRVRPPSVPAMRFALRTPSSWKP